MSAEKKNGNNNSKITIVEDSPTQAAQLKYILETNGYQVAVASNGREALTLVRSDRPDIVISDIVMPEMDGYELCKQIKTDDKLKDIPIMLLTALSDPADVIKSLECGADNFVTKPYDERGLLSQIEYLQLNRGLHETESVRIGLEIMFGGRKHSITSDRLQILNLLLSTYESAVSKNRELEQAQAELRSFNEQLEQRVKARSAELAMANEELRAEITERKQAEEALRQSEEKLRLMFETIPEGITVLDKDRKIVQSNKATASIYGYDNKEEIFGLDILELVAPKDHGIVKEIMKKTLDAGALGAVELTQLRKDRSEFPAELNGSVLNDASGKSIGFITIMEDITERKKMEKQLIMTDRLASVGELASGVAHELNNPLTGVIGLSQYLAQKDDLPKDIKEDLNLVYSEAQRAASVVKNLLTFARKHPPEKQLININEVIDKVLEIRAYEERVNNIEVVTHLAPNLPKIMADFFQLQQVFLNLVINAEHSMIEAHGKGTITITTRKVDSIVKVSFADDGLGISQENLGHIFDPFFTTKELGKGTGLGLSICHGIVSAHNGRIYAESKPSKGATFIVKLPLRQEQ